MPRPDRPDERVGERIRELRKIRGVTLQELADKVAVSVGYLSQIERNLSSLPIGTLRRISDALGVHIHWFFQPAGAGPEDERDVIVRARQRRRMSFTGIGIVEELLSPDLNGPLELLLSTIAPGADSGEYSHGGVEAGIVIEGTIELWVGGRHFRLDEGDSFSFRSSETHRCRNPARRPAKVVWVITPPHY